MKIIMANVILPVAIGIAVLIVLAGYGVIVYGIVQPIQSGIDSYDAGTLDAWQIVWAGVWIILSIIAIRILIALFVFACLGAILGAIED